MMVLAEVTAAFIFVMGSGLVIGLAIEFHLWASERLG